MRQGLSPRRILPNRGTVRDCVLCAARNLHTRIRSVYSLVHQASQLRYAEILQNLQGLMIGYEDWCTGAPSGRAHQAIRCAGKGGASLPQRHELSKWRLQIGLPIRFDGGSGTARCVSGIRDHPPQLFVSD